MIAAFTTHVMATTVVPQLFKSPDSVMTGFRILANGSTILFSHSRALLTLSIHDGLAYIDHHEFADRGFSLTEIDELCDNITTLIRNMSHERRVVEYGYDNEGVKITWDAVDNFSKFNDTNEELEVHLWMLDDKRNHMTNLIIEFDGCKLDLPIDKFDSVLSIIYDVEELCQTVTPN